MNAELQEKIDRAIAVLRENEPKDEKGYALAFSGGKDSCVIKLITQIKNLKEELGFTDEELNLISEFYFKHKYYDEALKLFLYADKDGWSAEKRIIAKCNELLKERKEQC